MKKAVLVSCFDYYTNRLSLIERYLRNKGYEVEYITSDYDHIKKESFICSRPNSIQLKTIHYKKNLSITRLLSHYLFSRKVLKEIRRLQPHLLYVMLPPNSLASAVAQYKRNNDSLLFFDIYDLWPESFPSTFLQKALKWPFYLWSNLRDKNLSLANLVITECDLYQDLLKDKLVNVPTKTLHLAKSDSEKLPSYSGNTDSVNLCYLGSINHAIDIELITKIIGKITKLKPVTLHIIGDGENRNKFISAIKHNGAKVKYYGKVFDEEEKIKIFDMCSFGINIMRETACVGLTMKSIDYFHAGLPLINNITADTTKIVEKYNAGYNISENKIDYIVQRIANVSSKELLLMKSNSKEVFNNYFSYSSFNNTLDVIFKEINT